MELILTVEGQNCMDIGLSKILSEMQRELAGVLKKNNEESLNKYGTEFISIAIIPTCVDDGYWDALGWKERKQVWRKKREADIRLRMNYDRFIHETAENQRLLFIDIVIKSIQVIQERSKGDFRGEELIADILNALDVTQAQLAQLNDR